MSSEEENQRYLDYLAVKRGAIKELVENELTKMESEVEYLKLENQFMERNL